VAYRGLIREDVMNKIWDISKIPLPFTDAVGSDTVSNPYTEWTTDQLAAPVIGGWTIDGAQADQNDAAAGARIGNSCGILIKELIVSQRANNVDVIGRGNELAYQVMMRQQELRRNVEANLLGIQGSANDTGTVAGNPAGLAAMVDKFVGASTGTGGVFSAGVWSAWTPPATGTGQGLTETLVRDACQSAWTSGSMPSLLMSVPSMIRNLSSYMFTSSARIATIQRDEQGNKASALGTVNIFITDFGVTLEFVPNRLQQTYTSNATQVCSVFILDPAYARVGYLHGYKAVELGATGLSQKKLLSVDFTLKVLNPAAHRVIPDVNPTTAVVA
jgi:hypothetical protein